MEQVNVFEVATRKKYRFKVANRGGNLSVEDLWDLSLDELDAIAVELDAIVEKGATKSFITKKSDSNKEATQRFDLVKHIIDVKMEEAEKRKKAAENRRKRTEILEQMAKKRNEALGAKSLEELQAELLKIDEEEEA